MQAEWTYQTSCPPYSKEIFAHDGRNQYVVADEPCARCGCTMARVSPDGDFDGESMRDLTTYWCADCNAKVERPEYETPTVDGVRDAIAESMFRGWRANKLALVETLIACIDDLFDLRKQVAVAIECETEEPPRNRRYARSVSLMRQAEEKMNAIGDAVQDIYLEDAAGPFRVRALEKAYDNEDLDELQHQAACAHDDITEGDWPIRK